MSLVEYARHEMQIAGMFDEDADYGGALATAILEIVQRFAEQGFSGAAAGVALAVVERVLRFKPLTPLTGEDGEWIEVAEGMWQNRRCGHVFRRADGTAYDLDAVVFREPNGACYTNSESRRDITFPYVPTTEFVDRA